MIRATRLARTLRRFRDADDGAALIEFAIVAMVLVMLVVGMMDMGRFIFLRNNLVSAARDGARIGSVTQLTAADSARVVSAVKNLIVDDSAQTATVMVDKVTQSGTTFVRVRVVNYPFRRASILPFIKQRIDTARAVFRWEFQ